jgi:hypothetical protein
MSVVHVVTMIGMFFNPALREMDARREPDAKPADVRAAAQDGETMMASRRRTSIDGRGSASPNPPRMKN